MFMVNDHWSYKVQFDCRSLWSMQWWGVNWAERLRRALIERYVQRYPSSSCKILNFEELWWISFSWQFLILQSETLILQAHHQEQTLRALKEVEQTYKLMWEQQEKVEIKHHNKPSHISLTSNGHTISYWNNHYKFSTRKRRRLATQDQSPLLYQYLE